MARSHKKRGAKRKNLWIFINSGIFLALLSIGATWLTGINSNPKPNPEPSPRIEVDDVRVNNSGSTLTVLLRNIGNQIAIIKSASFLVQRSTTLPQCISQGDLDTSGRYGLLIPLDTKPGETLKTEVSQQESPDSADKFSFNLRLPAGGHGVYVYELKMSLYYDNVQNPLVIGSVLVSLPIDPDDQFLWTKDDATTHMAGQGASPDTVAAYSRCLVQNSKAIEPLLKSSAVRSPDLSTLQSMIAYCCVLSATSDKRNS